MVFLMLILSKMIDKIYYFIEIIHLIYYLNLIMIKKKMK